MGTPDFAVPALRAVASACDLTLVVTRPDQPRGRGRATGASQVAGVAGELQVPVLKPADVNAPDVREALARENADAFAVVAFGGILRPETLSIPRFGCMNLHGSLLPDYRGASPVQRALWDGRTGTGVTTLWMDAGIDTGDMVLQRWTPIDPEDDAGSLAARLAALGAPLLVESLKLAHAGRAPRTPQSRDAGSYARKLRKEDGVVSWGEDVITVWNRQRAVTPWPGAATGHRGRALRIEKARPEHVMPLGVGPGTVLDVRSDGVVVACRPGALEIMRVRPESRPSMGAGEWARGARVAAGDVLEAVKEVAA